VRIVVKIGGAQLEEVAARAELARSVRSARGAGHEIVIVHGGGNQIRELVRRLGLPERYHEGLRVTDAETADVVLMVLAGLVNKQLVHALEASGVRAAGLCGADGSTFLARPTAPEDTGGVELGYVGSVARADRVLVEALLGEGYLPVIATAAPLEAGASAPSDHFYNINADLAVGPLARALEADAALFLTDVPGVLDASKQRIATLTPPRAQELRASGVIAAGMVPKVESALAALTELPAGLVKIAPAAGEDAVLRALDPAVGTRFVMEA
jgi:acetylglutamate kinase